MDITNYVRSCVDDFQSFVGIDNFPDFKIIPKEITLEKAAKHGYDAPASAIYDSSTGLHSLEIWSLLNQPQMNIKHLIFHELTHIWDAELYSKKDKEKHLSNNGYSEYHAAQIQFMLLLGAKSINEPISFDMKQKLEIYRITQTAEEYVEATRKRATELIQRSDFPANFQTLFDTVGVIFNYLGCRSICKMFAKNYDDKSDLSVISSFIGKDVVKFLNDFMLGWLEPARVARVDILYYNMVISLAQKYHLL